MSYYKRFKIIIATPFFQQYLRWSYHKGIKNLESLDYSPNFSKKVFTVLLCGVGNEGTANQFIKFVIKRNPKAKFIIIDLGKEQIEAVNKLVKKKYPDLNITTKQMNALDLQKIIKNGTIDWIETDGFLEFFDKKSLSKILLIWLKLLAKDGFITTRMPIYRNKVEKFIFKKAVWIAKIWLGVDIYSYENDYFENQLSKSGFNFIDYNTAIPTLQGYSMIKL